MADCSKAVSLRLRVFPEQPDITRPAKVQRACIYLPPKVRCAEQLRFTDTALAVIALA
jgi:hypothetical protein